MFIFIQLVQQTLLAKEKLKVVCFHEGKCVLQKGESCEPSEKRTYLKQRMSIKLIEEVHNSVRVKSGATHDNMVLIRSSVGRVISSQFLPFHPGESKLFKLGREYNQSNTYHGHHKQLRWPDIWNKISVTNCWKRYNNKIYRLEQIEPFMSRPLKMLYSAHRRKHQTHQCGR